MGFFSKSDDQLREENQRLRAEVAALQAQLEKERRERDEAISDALHPNGKLARETSRLFNAFRSANAALMERVFKQARARVEEGDARHEAPAQIFMLTRCQVLDIYNALTRSAEAYWAQGERAMLWKAQFFKDKVSEQDLVPEATLACRANKHWELAEELRGLESQMDWKDRGI